MTRLLAIPLLLALSIGLGYAAVVATQAPNTLLIDLAFVLSVLAFLLLAVAELARNLHRPFRPQIGKRAEDRERSGSRGMAIGRRVSQVPSGFNRVEQKQ